MSACKHIAGSLMGFLQDNSVTAMTMQALEQFSLDVKQCEEFAESSPVPGIEEGILKLAFADLRQLLHLFLTKDWSSYLADFGNAQAKYVRVKPQVAASIMEKLSNSEKKKGKVFSSLSKNDRDKKKLQEDVLKKLRGLMNGQMATGMQS
ncbi:EXOC6-like protein [Mya arenaria]|uniref:EXOC6-like protein n=2 Tax=Mya arenaria TaxID=6604 RepID=A0ABY7FJ26_MYAAR|nr:EXOC6-like protein [Mya arenaria]